ncbi:2Fe-2S iron-sulfur cluster-binding protein [Sphingomonas cavernae]|uniref:2Fe-2S ferredoxin n=1 Tax=Sphingomonas cavernae TaxID=2320861 RepID=A0A418WMN0_9SPHN|nr:2Fe-2S iron-sulfur cluster-binding protein [Sphingomonas cavernae]RJF91252.1 2Fe-2S ferredoxin [Sphingomonas cavernae]
MVKVTFVEPNGTERHVSNAEEGQSLMEVGKANGIDGILADCGGACSCATCHVFVDPQWWERVGPPDEVEFAMLDMVADVAQDMSRLSCQVKINAQLDGLRVTVAPASDF